MNEKYVICIVVLLFIIISFGGYLYLPGDTLTVTVLKKHIKRAGDDVFIPQQFQENRQVL